MSAASWPGRDDSGIGIAPVRRGPGDPDLFALNLYGHSLPINERKRRIPGDIGRDADKPGSCGTLCKDLTFSFLTHTEYITG
jgi:hypothetical protein